jgi:hypothetical protein
LRPHLILATLRKSALAIVKKRFPRSMQKQREAGTQSDLVIPAKGATRPRAGIHSVTLMFRTGFRIADLRCASIGFRDDAGFIAGAAL